MCTASSASRTYGSSASASEYTATALIPIRRAVRITRLAISPRLATSTESSIRSAYWSSREPKGAGGDWTDERGGKEPPQKAPGGERDNRAPGGERDNRAPGGERDNRAPGGERDNRAPGGERDHRAPGGERDNR